MTDLTEKYKQKQLKWYEEYYVDLENNGDIKKLYLEDDWCFYDGIVDHNLKHNPYMVVYDKVPSYEEYQKLKESRAELNSDIVDKAYENAQLKSEYKAECKRADELEDSYWKEVENNKKLKELLKRAKVVLEDEGDYMIVQEINEVLK